MSLPPIAILAGGLATRLQPIAAQIPKSLVEVAGEPFLAHQLRLLKRRGANKVALLVGHLGEQIERFAGDGSAFGLNIFYSRDGGVRRGTGGAVRNALAVLGERFFITYGDSYLDVPLEPMVRALDESGCPAAMAVFHNMGAWDPSNVIFDGQFVRLHDKRAADQPGVEWIDYGLTLFTATPIRNWPGQDPFDLSELTNALSRRGQLAGVKVSKRFYEMGKREGLAELDAYLRSKITSTKPSV